MNIPNHMRLHPEDNKRFWDLMKPHQERVRSLLNQRSNNLGLMAFMPRDEAREKFGEMLILEHKLLNDLEKLWIEIKDLQDSFTSVHPLLGLVEPNP